MENLPKELMDAPRWCLWKLETSKTGKPTKVPYSAHLGRAATNRPETWSTYQEAAARYESGNYSGLGFVLGGHSKIMGIDIDHCIDQDGNITPEASSIVETMNSYTEISPSGEGLHILFTAAGFNMEGKERKNTAKGIELYDGNISKRYLTVTGKSYGKPRAIREATAEAEQIHARYIAKPVVTNEQPNNRRGNLRTDAEIITAMKRYKPAAGALFDGDITGYGSHSEADLALFNSLLGFCEGDPARAEQLFRQSGLYRLKWDEKHGAKTYGQITIERALANFTLVSGKNTGTYSNENKSTPQIALELPKSNADYLTGGFEAQIEEYRAALGIKTGYRNLDEKLGDLIPGLYLVGATTGAGKTTFCLQMADQIAASGYPVLYFALEQGKHELVAKSITRKAYQAAKNPSAQELTEINANHVKRGNLNRFTREALEQYKAESTKMFIIEGDFKTNINTVTATVEQFIAETGQRPVIVVDYLQLIQSGQDEYSDKKRIDNVVYALKQMQRATKTVCFVISSFNRDSYKKEPSLTSFKESGGIEYTADVVIALYRDEEMEGADKTRRYVNVKVLKNRYGSQTITNDFWYYAAYDYFKDGALLSDYQEQKSKRVL